MEVTSTYFRIELTALNLGSKLKRRLRSKLHSYMTTGKYENITQYDYCIDKVITNKD
jgi:hypothetical protein